MYKELYHTYSYCFCMDTSKANCIRQVANWSMIKPLHRFEKKEFDIQQFRKDMLIASPKIVSLFEKIRALDDEDLKRDNKLYKHMIFSDVKQMGYGAKIIASAFFANGYTSYYDKYLQPTNTTTNKSTTFALLSSTLTYGRGFPVNLRRQIIQTFNKRPDNIHGENIRFILLDSGFKEGLDLFDIKYVHIFEPSLTPSDETQVIGRGTRFCGQKGLTFHPTLGWPLQVYKYEIEIPSKVQTIFGETQLHPLFLKYSGIDIRKILFANNLEQTAIIGAVDRMLTKNIHHFEIRDEDIDIDIFRQIFSKNESDSPFPSDKTSSTSITLSPMDISPKYSENYAYSPMDIDSDTDKDFKKHNGGAKKKRKNQEKKTNKDKAKPKKTIFRPKPPQKFYSFPRLRKYIQERYSRYTWPSVKMENLCNTNGGSVQAKGHIVKFTPTQEFVRMYFQTSSVYKGLLAWHSVGTGKTCTAIATATSSFEKDGYSILWVTRHTLKPDIWKNMFDQVCSVVLRNEWKKGNKWPETLDAPMRYLSDRWLAPISYKQFSNLLKGKNKLYQEMVKRNGSDDPLRKTLVIIDEAHKLYTSDLPTQERPDVKVLKRMVHNSYRTSGKDSVRLLLMTATPYTSEPMDLIKLLNLLRTEETALPESFEDFSKEYLDVNGDFTLKTKYKFLNDIAGYISYLNREKDARQFAYPVFETVKSEMSLDSSKLTEIALKELQHDLENYTSQQKEQKEVKKEVRSKIKMEIEQALEEICKDKKPKKPCQDAVKKAIQAKRERLFYELEQKMDEKEVQIKETKKQVADTKKLLHYQQKTDLSQEKALIERCHFKVKKSKIPNPKKILNKSITQLPLSLKPIQAENL